MKIFEYIRSEQAQTNQLYYELERSKDFELICYFASCSDATTFVSSICFQKDSLPNINNLPENFKDPIREVFPILFTPSTSITPSNSPSLSISQSLSASYSATTSATSSVTPKNSRSSVLSPSKSPSPTPFRNKDVSASSELFVASKSAIP